MADTSFEAYQKSGFGEASGVADLQAERAKIPTSDADLRTQAETQYRDTYNALDSSLSRQISSIIASQANDEQILNNAYGRSISSMADKLRKRGLLNGTLPDVQTAAINRHRNETMDVRASIYENQLALPEGHKELLKTDYEKAISQRIAINRQTNISTTASLLQKIYELQSSSFSDYINYLLNESRKSQYSSGGRRYSSSSKKSSSSSSYASGKDFKGGNQGILNEYYVGALNRRTTNLDKTGLAAKLYPNSAAARAYNSTVKK